MKVKKDVPELSVARLECVCGFKAQIHFEEGPSEVEWTCPQLDCRRMYKFEYEGRKRPVAREIEPLKAAMGK
jgi:hypothetical protein